MTVRRWLASTPRRTFILYPVCTVLLELLLRHGTLAFEPAGLLLLAWGYAQYRLSGSYRTKHGGGGPGIDVPPTQIVDTGIYAYVRNPMYLGHLIFMAGLAVTFRSVPAFALLIFHIWWFHQRVVEDEKHMTTLFGSSFSDYARKVRRWGVV
jgi:protein-S-isoprenylcysteine O-methyltransferase Ste14